MFVPSRRGFLGSALLSGASVRPTAAAGLRPAGWIPKIPERWQASWIWEDYNRETASIFVCLRKVVKLSAPVRAADVWCTANSFYRLYVNGQEAGMGPEPNEPPLKYYDYYELGRLFRPGPNIVAALAYNLGIGTHFYGAGPGGFLLEAHLTLEDGSKAEILTDHTWRTAIPRWYSRYAPQMLWASGFQELYDLRKVVPDWHTNPEEPPSSMERPPIRWRWASEFGVPPCAPFTEMLPREVPPQRRSMVAPVRVVHTRIGELPADWLVRQAETMSNPNPNVMTRMALVVEEDAPAGLVEGVQNILRNDAATAAIAPPPSGKSARVLIDFGEEVVGYPAIDFSAMDGGLLDIGYSEFLKKGDKIDLLRDVLQADRLILGQGAHRWESYDRRAFRFMLLEAQGLRGPLQIRHVNISRAAYPVEYAGRFECSDDLLNRIWRACRLSCELNMHDHYEDGPVRERGQYAGDIRTTALWNYYLFGDRLLIAKGLRHFARIQDPSGWFKTLSPSGTRHNIVEMMLQWALSIWEYYWYTGDKQLALELAPYAYRAVRWFEKFLAGDGLIGKADQRDWWVFIDWGTFDFRDEIAGLNLWYLEGLEGAGKLARLRGDAAEVGHFAGLAARVREAIQRRFWNAREQAYVDCWTPQGPSSRITRQVNYMAMLSGAAPKERWRDIVDRVTRPDIERIQTPYFKYFELCCWLMAGRPLTEVLNETRAWWGEQVRRGAKTFWEVFDDRSAPDSVPEGTCCHSWVGGPVVILGQEVLGVTPLAPGFEKVRIRPQWADLEFAGGAVPTPKGLIEIAWNRAQKRIELSLPAVQADIALWFDSTTRSVTLDGREILVGASARPDPEGYWHFELNQGGRHVVEMH